MLKGFEHAWICRKCQSEASVVTGKDYDEMENKLKNKGTNCCGVEYEYIGLRPIIINIASGPILKADENYQPPIEKVEEIIENEEITEVIENEEVEDKEIEEEIIPQIIEKQIEEAEETKLDVKETEIETSETSFNIDDLVVPGPKGVSNAQMIPAMKNAIKENSKEKLDIIKSHYPDIFDSSIKYIGKKMQDQLKALGF